MTKAEIDDIFGEFEIDEDYRSRPRTSLACSSPSRRSPRLRSLPLLRKPPQKSLMRTQTPRRRIRRRRRPPSKCHLLIAEVEICSKHSFYLRALKITVIRKCHLLIAEVEICSKHSFYLR